MIWIKVRLKALCMGFLTHFESYQNINFSQFCDTLKYCAFYEGRTVYIINQVSQNYSIPLNFKITSTSNRLIPRSLIPTRDLAFESPWSGLSKNIYIVGGLRHERHLFWIFQTFKLPQTQQIKSEYYKVWRGKTFFVMIFFTSRIHKKFCRRQQSITSVSKVIFKV